MNDRTTRANALRILSIDAIWQANSGHAGMPMGMADIAEVLWHDHLQHSPNNPLWVNRDRFILSNGHGSMLLYALLHLTGYPLGIEDLKNFRQLHSRTPGHPERGITPGVETTTGPLGQGLANAVGMAIAEKHLAASFNQPGFPLIDYYTYVFVGDGCLMEGISHEVSSLAGVLGLGKLIVFYDDNGISIDGEVKGWFRDNTPQRFQAYGWQVITVDGHDSQAITTAIQAAKAETDQPSLLCCQTIIGKGSPTQAGSHIIHGASLNAEEIAAIRQQLAWPSPPFVLPEAIYVLWDARQKGEDLEQAWNKLFANYQATYPTLATELTRRLQRKMPEHWQEYQAPLLQQLINHPQPLATRKASQLCLNYYANQLPEIMGGSADLTESNGTYWEGAEPFTASHPAGRYLHYGVREFGMSAIMNGLALSNAILPFGGTFLTFSDYARNAIRLAALMQLQVIFVYTHDSIGLGEDGPTHQPIEHLSSLRLIPQLCLWRPCDGVETAIAWSAALEKTQAPTCLALSRQALAPQKRSQQQIQDIRRGGYILLKEETAVPDAILIATGSEVSLAIAVAKQLLTESLAIRVVSMPSANTFYEQTLHYQEKVLPSSILARVAIEAGASRYWVPFVGPYGTVIGIDQFGLSAPGEQLLSHFGFNIEHIIFILKNIIFTQKISSSDVGKQHSIQ